MNARDAVTAFISQELLGGQEIEHDKNLLEDDTVDSLGMLRLVAHLEERYQIEIPPEQFTIENFRTINTISDYLGRVIDQSG